MEGFREPQKENIEPKTTPTAEAIQINVYRKKLGTEGGMVAQK